MVVVDNEVIYLFLCQSDNLFHFVKLLFHTLQQFVLRPGPHEVVLGGRVEEILANPCLDFLTQQFLRQLWHSSGLCADKC